MANKTSIVDNVDYPYRMPAYYDHKPISSNGTSPGSHYWSPGSRCNVHGIYGCMTCYGNANPVTSQRTWLEKQLPPLEIDIGDDLDDRPYKCPVCEGRGFHADDFYGDGSDDCRTCEGCGIVWG